MTSTKKVDHMTTTTNTFYDAPLFSNTVLQQPAELIGGVTYIMPWICTARAAVGSKVLPSTRSASTVFMRGLKENVQFQTSNGTHWQWRRICVTLKDQAMYDAGSDQSAFSWWRSDSAGVRRMVSNLNGLSVGLYFIEQLFRGRQSLDWSSYFNAPVDTHKMKLHYDKTFKLGSGNESGIMRHFKMWHPMNKNLTYDDDESGAGILPSAFSTHDKRGMGDYMVIDIISAATASDSDDRATLSIDSALYWHEK